MTPDEPTGLYFPITCSPCQMQPAHFSRLTYLPIAHLSLNSGAPIPSFDGIKTPGNWMKFHFSLPQIQLNLSLKIIYVLVKDIL